MARKASSDRILTEGENEARIEAMNEYLKNNDPRKTYTAKYMVNGQKISETIKALTQKAAIDQVKYNCSLVGWQAIGLEVTEQM